MLATIAQRYHEFMADSCCSQLCDGPNPHMARNVFGFISLSTNLLAWMVRDYGNNALAELEHLKDCQGGHDCLGTEGVLRVSLGCFIFYFAMFLTTVGTMKLHECRDSWHLGWWPLKSLIWIALMAIPFFIPSAFIQFYGEVARFGAGIFLIIQLFSVINFITWGNDYWVLEKNVERCRILMITMSTMAYAASLAGIILMYIWYAPKASCVLNIFFITWTLLLQLMTSISLHSKVNASLMTSGLMGLYVVFLCWCVVRSEPATEICNTRPQTTGRGDWMTIVLGLVMVVTTLPLTAFSPHLPSACPEELCSRPTTLMICGSNRLQNMQVITEGRGIRMVRVLSYFYHVREPESDEEVTWFKNWCDEVLGNCLRKLIDPKPYRVRQLQLVATEDRLLESILRRVESPNLTWLRWNNCPFSCLPPWIPMKNIRVLEVV